MKLLIFIGIILALALILSGCQIITGLHDNQRVITWTIAATPSELARKCERLFENINGCAFVKENECEIVTLEPADYSIQSLGTLGHETLHCFRGNFHK